TPDVVPLTVATIVHVFPGVAIDPPPNESVPDPLTAVTDPLQPLVGTGGFTTTIPLGRLSINVIVVSAPGFAAGLVMTKVTVVWPPTGIDVAPNALVIVGAVNTFSVAVLLVVPVPPSVELIVPVMLAFAPGVSPWTLTLSVQVCVPEPLKPIVPPDRLTVVSPLTGANVPPQLLTTPGV